MNQPPDSYMTDEQGQHWRVYWSNASGQFESEPASAQPTRTTKPQPEYGPLPPLRVFSFGGGVQSVACEVLAAQGKIDYQHFVFCNVGDDSESPQTLEYYHKYALPFAKANGLTMTELRYIRRDHASYNVAKTILGFVYQVAIPRTHLCAAYGEGFQGAPLRCNGHDGQGSRSRDRGECDEQARPQAPSECGGADPV